jgi:hypothetical protein
MSDGSIEKVVTKVHLKDQPSDAEFWRTKSYAERIGAVEEIRLEYNRWKYPDAEQRLQRVYRIVKLK